MEKNDPIVIVGSARTPIGNLQGELKDLTAIDLGAAAIEASVERANLTPDQVNSVIMGCVLPAGLGQAPARQAALKAGLPLSTDCTTINKMCGSGMKAVMLGYDFLLNEKDQVVVAGGMESMSNAPHLLTKSRQGYRLGHQTIIDHMLYDGLEDAYEKGNLMGVYADRCAAQKQFSRETQDEFALNSVRKAQEAANNGYFDKEITSVTIKSSPKGEEKKVTKDEGPQTAKPEKIPSLRAAFTKDGTVTAANSSSISDGAAALVLMRQSKSDHLGIKPLAKIIGHASYSAEPGLFTTAPIFAIKRLLQKISWSVQDVDLWEINEAFAVVTLAAITELNLPSERVNIHGGACVLGHPIGASGARILVTLIHALARKNLKRGVAALCIGGGEATAVAVELI